MSHDVTRGGSVQVRTACAGCPCLASQSSGIRWGRFVWHASRRHLEHLVEALLGLACPSLPPWELGSDLAGIDIGRSHHIAALLGNEGPVWPHVVVPAMKLANALPAVGWVISKRSDPSEDRLTPAPRNIGVVERS